MANCAIYIVPPSCVPGPQNRFDPNGSYSFKIHYETQDGNLTYNDIDSPLIAWSSSDQQIDNAIMDAVIADSLSHANVVITRSDCRIFR